ASSNLNIQQVHDGAQGSNQESQSEDEPHVLKHQVTKPIIQEEIHPVIEEIMTIVARGQEQRQSGYGGGGQSGGYGMSAGGSLGLGGAIGGGISIGGGSSSSGSSSSASSGNSSPIEIKATSGSGLGKGLVGKTAGGYASSAKASSGGTKGY
ncbi:PREDICTED: keratin, type I cytoskeletal 9-like, partial [Rhagoletis zephyria]|uniref:keratin, type I cytoskeletal 9-like n=1 Tax=Rhagoletis zephyria TaxID=28612 RepID=UPI00081120BA